MKKLLIVITLFLAASAAGFAQEKMKVDFHGIDFTEVNVVGAGETSLKFIAAFGQINGLMISEQKKYDVGDYFRVNVLSTNIDCAVGQLPKLNEINFKDRGAREIQIDRIVSEYPASDNNGMVIIAKELNKLTNIGTFVAVIYDGTTKQILFEKEFSGKAGGIGLRNYWAGALYNGMKNMRL